MFKRITIKALKTSALALAAALVFSGIVLAADFSATTVQKFGDKTRQGKIYISGTKERLEFTNPRNGNKQIMIVRGDKHQTWHINPAKKTYRIIPYQGSAKNMMARGMGDATVKKASKTETINGQTCEKAIYTMKAPRHGTVTVWTSKKLQWPVKAEAKMQNHTMSTQLTSIKTGKQNSSLFEIPKGYTKDTTKPGNGFGPTKRPAGRNGNHGPFGPMH